MRTHQNNIGFLRLFFASMVIVGHAPEIIDHNRVREPLTVLFHTISLGDIAVDAFFILSGFLITKSFFNSKKISIYLERRVLRIVPGFVVAYLVSVFVVGVLLGARPWRDLSETLFRMVLLCDPKRYPIPGSAMVTPPLNGSMWTILYEFKCYILIAVLGVAGILRQRRTMLGLAALLLIVDVVSQIPGVNLYLANLGPHSGLRQVVGDPYQSIRLTSAFLSGSVFFLFQDKIMSRLSLGVALVSFVIWIALLYDDPYTAQFGTVTFGALALFWLSFKAELGPVQTINDKWDISYGVYLYGWPAAVFILWTAPGLSPVELAVTSLGLAAAAGALSWWGVEKWTKDLVVVRRDVKPAAPELRESV